MNQKVYDRFLDRLRERVAAIQMGDPAENAYMGPVVNEGAMTSILNYSEVGKKEGRIVAGGGRASNASEGYFIQPTVIADLDRHSRLAQEEVISTPPLSYTFLVA